MNALPKSPLRGKATRVQRQVKGTVRIQEENIALRIPGQAGAAHPHRALAVAKVGTGRAIGRQVQYAGLLQRGFAIGHQPTGIGIIVAMRSPCQVNLSVHQQQAYALCVLGRVEDLHSVGGTVTGPGEGGLNLRGAARQLRARSEVQRMQPLVIVAARILRHRDKKDGSVAAVRPVDYRSVGNSNLRRDLAAAMIVTGRLVRCPAS